MKSGSWQGKEIGGIIRTLAVNCAPILYYSKDDGKTPAETASDEMALGAVHTLCESPLLVSQQNHSDLSLTALDNALKRFSKKMGFFQDKQMSKSMKVKVDEQFATKSNQLQEQMIHTIRTSLEVLVYRPEKVTTSKQRQFQVHLTSARQAATKWLESDWSTKSVR
jgi:hypothetical protein